MKRKSIYAILTVFILAMVVNLSLPVSAAESEDTIVYETPYGIGRLQNQEEDAGIVEQIKMFIRRLAASSLASESVQEEIKEVMKAGMEAKESKIDLKKFSIPNTVENQKLLFDLAFETVYENPQIFYVKTEASLMYNASNLTAYVPVYDETLTSAECSTKYEAAINEALNIVKSGMSDVEKALAFHDYIAQNCEYDVELLNSEPNIARRSAYHALVDGIAVCQGYTQAFNDLLRREGISFGTVDSQSMNHVWSKVNIDGAWYHVDVTYDDPIPNAQGRAIHDNFLRSDNGLAATGHYGFIGGTCTSTTYDAGMYWSSTDTAVQFRSASDVRYLTGAPLNSANPGLLTSIQLTDKSGNAVYTATNSPWYVWGGTNNLYPAVYSYLSYYNNNYYFNDTTKVYRIGTNGSTASQVYEYKGNDGYIYGLMVKDGYMYLDIATHPNNTNTKVLVVPVTNANQSYEVPKMSVNYINETLTNTNGMNLQYSINGGSNWKSFTNGSSLSSLGWTGEIKEIMLRPSGANNEAYYTTVVLPARPGTENYVPEITAEAETIYGANDGKLHNLTTDLEYKLNTDSVWRSCADTTISNLAPGTYQVRRSATETAFASHAREVVIEAGAQYLLEMSEHTFTAVTYGYTAQSLPITVENTGETEATVTAVLVDNTEVFNISFTGSVKVSVGETVEIGTITPVSGKLQGTYTGTITVTYNNGKTVEAAVEFKVNLASQTRPSAPVLESKSTTQVVLRDDSDSQTIYEYRKGTSGAWQSSNVFDNLEPNTSYRFYRRKAAQTGKYSASSVSSYLSVTTVCDHDYGTAWYQDDTTNKHWQECTICGEETTKTAHTATGSYGNDVNNHWKTCTVCKLTYDAAGHTPKSAYDSDANNHWKDCSVCGRTLETAAHTWNAGVQTTAPQVGKPGVKTYTCTACSRTKTEEIPVQLNVTATIASATFTSNNYGYSAAPAAKTISIKNNGNVAVTISSVTSSADWLIVQNGTTEIAAGATNSSYSIRPKTGLSAGTYRATVTVTYHGKTTVTSEVTFTVNKAAQTAPAAPIESAMIIETNKVILPAVTGCEYRVNGGAWQDSNIFEGLTDHTSYTFSQRKKADANHNASNASAGTTVTTLCIHDYGTEWYHDETTGTHWQECIKCYEQTTPEKHTPDAEGIRQGETQHWYVCEVCGENYDGQDHVEADGWKHNASGHWKYCEVCEKQLGTIAEHEWDEGTQTKAPTPTAPGTMLYTCTVCGETKEEDIEPDFWLEIAGVTFESAAYGYELPEAKTLVITNIGNVETTISEVTVTPADKFTVIAGNDPVVTLNGTNTNYQIQPKAGLNVGNYTARITITYNEEITSSANVSFTVTKATSAAPTVAVDYMGEALSTKSGMLYSVDGGNRWMGCTDDMSAASFGWDGSSEKTVAFKTMETQNYTESPVTTIKIPARPAAPTGLNATNESIQGRNDGTITGTTEAMEYRVWNPENAWKSCAGADFSKVAPATYEFRVKATEDTFASEAVRVTVEAGEPATYTLQVGAVSFEAMDYGYTPAEKSLIITSTGNSDASISDVTVTNTTRAEEAYFTITKGNPIVKAGQINDSYKIAPKEGLGAGTYNAMVTVTYHGEMTASAAVSFTVEKATSTTPEVTIDFAEEKLSTTKEMQYSIDQGETWIDCIKDMSATAFGWNGNSDKIVKFRIPENDNHTASDEQEVTIPARPNAPLGLTAVEEQTVGANDGQITGVTAEMEYKAVASGQWISCQGTVIENLAPGSYVVRYKVTDVSFSGHSSETLTVREAAVYALTINADSYADVTYGYAQADAPEKVLSIKNTGNRATTITSVESNAAWLAVTGENGVEIQPGSTVTSFGIRPDTGLGAGEYKAVITVTFTNGTPVTKEVTLKVKKASQSTPAAPVAEKIEETKVTLKATEGYEYSKDGKNWQTSNEFTGLDEFTEYLFYQRKAGTANYLVSASSEAVSVKTLCSHSVLSDYETNETHHWKECKKCNEHFYEAPHAAADEYKHDTAKHWKDCKDCGKVLETAVHTWAAEGTVTGLTPDTDGIKTYDCIGGCAEKKIEEVPRVFKLNVTDVTFETPAVFGYENAPEGKVITITSTGNVFTTIDHVTTNQTGKFEVTAGDDVITVGGTNTSYCIRPKTGLEAGTHKAEIIVTYGNGSEVFGTAKAEVTFTVNKAAQTAPTVAIDYLAEALNTTTALEYSMDGVSNWTDCSKDMGVHQFGWNESTSMDVYFRKGETDNYNAGSSVKVTIPARPAAPEGLAASDETIQGWKDGKITGVTVEMEYRPDSGTWRSCEGVSFDAVAAGNYEFRYAAKESTFASKSMIVTVEEGAVPDYTLTAEDIVFDTVDYGTEISQKVLNITSTGNVGTVIENVTLENETFNGNAVTESNFVITAGDGQVAVLGQNHNFAIQPKADLDAGSYEAVVKITYNHGINAATAKVSLTVEKAEQSRPSAPTVEEKTTTSVTLTEAAGCEYSKDGSTWQSSNKFTGLDSFKEYTFYQRMKADANHNASESSEGITVKTLCAHSYGTDYVKDESDHWKVCLICEEADRKTAHQYTAWENDENQHWQACICGAATEKADHAADPDEFRKDENGHWKVCKDCGEVFGSDEHVYSEVITVKPTVNRPGNKRSTCDVCGYYYDTELPASPCKDECVPDTAGGLKKDEANHPGEHWYLCINCEGRCEIALHSWTPGEIIKEATYREAGLQEYNCECGASKEVEIPVKECTDHVYTSWEKDADMHWQICDQCDAVTEKADHMWTAGVILKEATYREAGLQEYNCECGITKEVEIPVKECTDHVYTSWEKDAHKHWQICDQCDAVTEKADHMWIAGTVITEPTYTTEGLQEYDCICGAVKEVKLPVVPCPGHIWDEGIETKAPTLTEEGEKLYTCTLCEATRTEAIEKLADKTELNKEIEKVQQKLQFVYTAQSWEAYLSAAAEAQEILNKAYATEAEVLQAKDKLQAAEARLEVVEEKAPLFNAFEKAEEKEENHYTSETWNAYQEVVKKAEEVLAKENASEEEIKEILEALENAEKALKVKPTSSGTSSAPASPSVPVSPATGDMSKGSDWLAVLALCVMTGFITAKKRRENE